MSETVAATEPQMAGEGGGDITGYQLGPLIGRGGMGEVVLAHDPDIGRDVALERMKAATAEIQAWQLRQLLPRPRAIPSEAISTHI